MSEQLKSRSIWIGLALVLSLAINMFFIGTYVGGRAHSDGWMSDGWMDRMHYGQGPGGGFGPDGNMGPGGPGAGMGDGPLGGFDPRHMLRMLPEHAHDVARDVLFANSSHIRELLDASGTARFEAFEYLGQEPFDEVAMSDALAHSRAVDQELSEAVHGVWTEIMDGLTAEQRAEVAERMDEGFLDRQGRRDRYRRRHEGRREGRHESRDDGQRNGDRRP